MMLWPFSFLLLEQGSCPCLQRERFTPPGILAVDVAQSVGLALARRLRRKAREKQKLSLVLPASLEQGSGHSSVGRYQFAHQGSRLEWSSFTRVLPVAASRHPFHIVPGSQILSKMRKRAGDDVRTQQRLVLPATRTS